MSDRRPLFNGQERQQPDRLDVVIEARLGAEVFAEAAWFPPNLVWADFPLPRDSAMIVASGTCRSPIIALSQTLPLTTFFSGEAFP